MEEYKILAKDWEKLNPKEEIYKQKDFFKKVVDRYSPKTCLDCACGLGFHLHLLHELGLRCCGSDLSPDMISIARAKAADSDIVLKEANYRNLGSSWDLKFDMIICMSNAIRHMLDEAAVVDALNSMYERLNDNGILIIDNGFGDNLLKDRPKLLPGRILKDQAFYFILEYPSASEVVFNILKVEKTPESFDHSFESIRLNTMGKADYERCLAQTGFRSVNYYGDFKFSAYPAPEGDRMIAIAQK